MENQRDYTIEEFCQLAGVSAQTLAKWRCAGNGPKFRKIGRRVSYPRALVSEWMDAQIQKSTSDRLAS